MEEWKDVVGYEGIYEISTLGNIREKEHKVKLRGNFTRTQFAREKVKTVSANGYEVVTLHKDSRQKQHYIHRLVAEAFFEPDPERPFINHRDGVKTNNSIENLEWCDQAENVFHAYRHKLTSKSKTVICLETGEKYDSTAEAARRVFGDIRKQSGIRQCAAGIRHSAYGFHWNYA